MKSDPTKVSVSDVEKQKKRWFQSWKSYPDHYRAKYNINFLLKPAHLDCELWFKERKYGEANFEVSWEVGANIAAPREHREQSPDRFGYLR